MKNTTQLLVTFFSLLIVFIFVGCSKQSVAPAKEGLTQSSSNPNIQSVTFNDITITSSQSHIFSIPAITATVVNSGYVTVYATTNSCSSSMQTSNSSMESSNSSMQTSTSSMQWQTLSTIYGCDLHVDVAVGQVTMQNNLGKDITMSFRFDVTGN